jgi:hypothetical protein
MVRAQRSTYVGRQRLEWRSEVKRKQDDVELEVKSIGIAVCPEHGPEGIVVEVGLRRPQGETPRPAGRIQFSGFGPGKWKQSKKGGNNTPPVA